MSMQNSECLVPGLRQGYMHKDAHTTPAEEGELCQVGREPGEVPKVPAAFPPQDCPQKESEGGRGEPSIIQDYKLHL
ncbi:hypothetical protein AOLI_G00314450 [Acnodon oligacanthus]